MTSKLIFILLSWILPEVSAKPLVTSYLSTEIPNNWVCTLQPSSVWACNTADPLQSKEALLVFAAKVAGPEDSLANYLVQFKTPKSLAGADGLPKPSQILVAQQQTLDGNPWVVAQHLGSELPGFYTTYLSTIKNGVAIQITFLVRQDRQPVHKPALDMALRYLKLKMHPQVLAALRAEEATTASVANTTKASSQGRKPNWLMIGMVAATLSLIVATVISLLPRKKKKTSRHRNARPRSK